jgi:SpoVK/Ycf46/Vps4 family AAA+-type ATPase
MVLLALVSFKSSDVSYRFTDYSLGKTLTVECIAMGMSRPLLSLTVADIGTEETSVESNLARYLGLASKWGAIVLIDEAETFLSRRKQSDLARNALLTAFLRALEYYSGMIFLTTNAPGLIDEAVVSRIHLALQYGKLDKLKRRDVWLAHINQLEQQQSSPTWPMEVPKVKIDETTQNFITSESGIENIEDLKMSGRDIRNAFQTAVKLARFEAQTQAGDSGTTPKIIKLQARHFENAMKTKFALKQAIKKIHHQDEDEMAADAGQR